MNLTGAAWALRRLSRMGPAEIVHRVGERVRVWQDVNAAFGWAKFGGFEGPLAGLPGLRLDLAGPEQRAIARDQARLVKAGQLAFLGQEWPQLRPGWWRGDAWTLDPVSGAHWPGAGMHNSKAHYRHTDGWGDAKFVWEANRLQILHPLAVLAVEEGGEEALTLGFDILAGWMDANPPFDGINWTSGIEAAGRIVSMAVLLAAAGDRLTPAQDARARAFLHAHARALHRYPSRFSSANNHRVGELVGLLLAKTCAPQLPIAGLAAREVLAALEAEIVRQFHADGVGAEQSPTYAAYSLEWFVLAAAAAEQSGLHVSDAYRARVRAGAEALVWLLDESGHAPRIGDDDESRALALTMQADLRYPSSVAAMALRWLGRPLPRPDLRPLELRDLLCAGRADPPIAASPSGVRTFEQGGVTVLRDVAAPGAVFVMDHGPHGFLSIAAHAHADALAATLNWGDEPVLVDAGTYLYHSGGNWRDLFRSTQVHNTLSIDLRDQSRMLGTFAWAAHANAELTARGATFLKAAHSGYRRRFGVTHERMLAWAEAGTILIEDRLIGRPTRDAAWRVGFSLAPGSTVELEGRAARVRTAGGRLLVLESAFLDWTLAEGHYSPRFNRKLTVPRLEFGGRLQGRASEQAVSRVTIRLVLG